MRYGSIDFSYAPQTTKGGLGTPVGFNWNLKTGKVIEFVDPELEALQRQIAEKLGFRLVDHRMELYGVTLDRKS